MRCNALPQLALFQEDEVIGVFDRLASPLLVDVADLEYFIRLPHTLYGIVCSSQGFAVLENEHGVRMLIKAERQRHLGTKHACKSCVSAVC